MGNDPLYEYEDWSDTIGPDDLTCRTSLGEFFAYHCRSVEQGRMKPEELERRRAILSQIAEGGGEWWEWVMGTDPMMQHGGVALVRDGQIAWACMTWIS